MAWWIFQNLVMTTVLAAAVALACRFGRIGPVARHALWVLVLVKFITPPLVVWPWAAPDPFGIAALDAPVPGSSIAAVEVAQPRSAGDSPLIASTETSPVATEPPEAAADHVAISAWPWLLGVWALGSLCLLCLEGVRLWRLSRRVGSSAADPSLLARVEQQCARLGIRPVPVVIVEGITSPVVWGWGPKLLWPSRLSADVTDACLDGIVVHELAHIKRGDHLVGWLELFAGVVWWWNPLFWSVRRALREQAELACDAWVISALPNGRRAYAESLLALSGAAVLSPSSMAVVGIRPTSRRVLERRLVMIMKGRASLRLPWVGLCCLALVAAATLPAWASAQQAPPPPPPAPVISISKQVPTRPVFVQKAPSRPRVVIPEGEVVVRYQAVPKVPPTVVDVKTAKAQPLQRYYAFNRGKEALPGDGQQLLEGFDADVKAIQEEANQKTEARRAAAIKALEALQDKYAREGKLDEAVAIRDYLRAGGPGMGAGRYTYTIKR